MRRLTKSIAIVLVTAASLIGTSTADAWWGFHFGFGGYGYNGWRGYGHPWGGYYPGWYSGYPAWGGYYPWGAYSGYYPGYYYPPTLPAAPTSQAESK